MDMFLLIVTLALAAPFPDSGTPQVYQAPTPPPAPATQYQPWQFEEEAIVVDGLIYYPTRERRFFDGAIMSQVSVYRGVPVYADVTLEPNSVVYLPVGRQLMRGYERRREGELAGTTGSRVPAFPVAVASPGGSELTSGSDVQLVPAWSASTASMSGTRPLAPAYETALATDRVETVPRPRTQIESIPRPRDNDGVWLEYAGTRWYSDGPAAPFDPDRFVEIGNYRGFPVYRDRNRGAEEIWVRVVIDGAVAPYAKR
jgi:hypothetical protein